MANTLACLRSCHWWTFWTYLVTDKLFSQYLMNFVFDTTLDAVGIILRVHYKSWKSDGSFSEGSVSTLFRWRERVFHVCVNSNEFFRVKITNVLPLFYESQSILANVSNVDLYHSQELFLLYWLYDWRQVSQVPLSLHRILTRFVTFCIIHVRCTGFLTLLISAVWEISSTIIICRSQWRVTFWFRLSDDFQLN